MQLAQGNMRFLFKHVDHKHSCLFEALFYFIDHRALIPMMVPPMVPVTVGRSLDDPLVFTVN